MTVSLLLSIAALLVSIVSASGVYLAPFVHNYFNMKNKQRESHKLEIRKYVLLPLISGINHFIHHEVQAYLTAGFEGVPSKDTLQRYIHDTFDFKVPPYIIPLDKISHDVDWFDDSLYQDLKCHNKSLYKEIESVGEAIRKKMPVHVEKRWKLLIQIYTALKPIVTEHVNAEVKKSGVYGMSEIEDLSSISTIVAMLKILKADPDSTGLYSLLPKLAGKETILAEIDAIASDNNYINMVDGLLQVENEVLKLLTDLRDQITNEATSGVKLRGKCHYLGYENSEC